MSDSEDTPEHKDEAGFISLDPRLASVEWIENEPIEVHLTGEITADSVNKFETSFREALRSGQPELMVVIQSEGGSMYDALKIVDILLTCEKTVVTVIRGYAMSAAVLIFSCGEKRIISPNSSIMIHSVSSTMFEGRTADLKVESAEVSRLNDKMCHIMAENTGKPKNFYTRRIEKNTDIYMSPEEAKEIGLATDIGDAQLMSTVRVNTEISVRTYNKRRKRQRVA
jgi:ATP-dependent Clp endopeptidase proteolytic subunit ClpP